MCVMNLHLYADLKYYRLYLYTLKDVFHKLQNMLTTSLIPSRFVLNALEIPTCLCYGSTTLPSKVVVFLFYTANLLSSSFSIGQYSMFLGFLNLLYLPIYAIDFALVLFLSLFITWVVFLPLIHLLLPPINLPHLFFLILVWTALYTLLWLLFSFFSFFMLIPFCYAIILTLYSLFFVLFFQ